MLSSGSVNNERYEASKVIGAMAIASTIDAPVLVFTLACIHQVAWVTKDAARS
jgi:hypothetical protein